MITHGQTELVFTLAATDDGATWFELGGVPVNNGTHGRSGFPSIFGTFGWSSSYCES